MTYLLCEKPFVRGLCLFALSLSLWGGSAVRAQSDIAEFEELYEAITFDFPLGIRFPNDEANMVYIVELGGRVKVFDNNPGAQEASIFLDISERLSVTSTGETGDLFAIEFHPDYAENGYFYARYKLMDPERTVLSRFSRSEGDPFVADVDSEVILFEVETPGNDQNHHGGDIAFGPDGYLYIPLGDGGILHDASGNAQDLASLLGKVLRIDVDNPVEGLNYGVPQTTPSSGTIRGGGRRSSPTASAIRGG